MTQPFDQQPGTFAKKKQSVGLVDLFTGFLVVGLRGFGGVLPWARQMIVEERQWLSPTEFTEFLSIGQLLPGPNIVNIAVILGAKFQGVRGSICAVGGLLFMPMVIVMILGSFYTAYGNLPILEPVFHNMAAAAVGLILAMGAKMVRAHAWTIRAVAIAGLAFAMVGLLRWPLPFVVLVVAPLAVLAQYHADRRDN